MQKRFLGLLILPLLLLAVCSAQKPKVRQPAVAGGFYPADAKELARMVDDLLARAKPPELAEPPTALVVPHAGYMYSGGVAAHAYALLKGRKYERVVVISPSHVDGFGFAAIYDGDAYVTPLGSVPVDKAFAAKLARAGSGLQLSGRGHETRANAASTPRGSAPVSATRARRVPPGAHCDGRSALRSVPGPGDGSRQNDPGQQYPDRGQQRSFSLPSL
jgi:hypothetical protein